MSHTWRPEPTPRGPAGDDRESLAARSVSPGGLEGCYVPGLQATDYRVFNAAKLIPANADIVFQVHYTTTGTAMTDKPEIGFTIAKEPPLKPGKK